MSQTLIPYDALKTKGIELSKTQIYRLERAGTFPRRVSVSVSRYAFVEAEVDQWIADRIAARPGVQSVAA
jgi:prophage regulatory protein